MTQSGSAVGCKTGTVGHGGKNPDVLESPRRKTVIVFHVAQRCFFNAPGGRMHKCDPNAPQGEHIRIPDNRSR